jgi:hypothetical protein
MKTRNWLMTPDQYLQTIIRNKSVTPIQLTDYRLTSLINLIKTWAGSYLRDIKLSGSSAKNVVVSTEADVDLFISLKSETTETLKEVYEKLAKRLKENNYSISQRTVAIQTTANGLKVDLVPGKLQAGYQLWHSLYNSDTGNSLQTNVEGHIDTILKSGRQDEIRAFKIWCINHSLKFPSIYLELIILEALYNKNKGQLAINTITILEYLRDKFVEKPIVDPSNTNNRLSDYLLTKSQKEIIAKKAGDSLRCEFWEQVIW